MRDEWIEEDLPVLEAVRRIEARLPTGDACNVEDVSAEADIEDVRVLQLLYRLVTAGYLIGVPRDCCRGG